ncbi:MAG TPA: DUF1007 family protein [Xanthobacteraceae bacterium]|nr:DUF1007 family protein [Xanthobacteraceae bacterium]
MTRARLLRVDIKRLRLSAAASRYGLRYLLAVTIALFACGAPGAAQAHPHVWATITTDLLYAADGSVTGVRHAWTFDEMFSAFATMGVKAKTKGHFTREELQPLAKVNVDSLKGFAYFTYATVDGVKDKSPFDDAVDYWLEYDPKATVLTLHFTLPFKKPVKAKLLKIEIYDPEFFIDFAFAKKNPITLVGAPPSCAGWTEKPDDPHFLTSQTLNKSFVPSEAFVGMGALFANNILVQCP